MGFLDSAAPIIGGLISGGLGLVGQQQANASNQASVDAQIAFQKQQSETQYQRATQDMIKAGINPMLASQVGGNAAMAGASASYGNVGQSAVNSAQAGAMLSAQLDKIKADTNASNTQAALNTAGVAKTTQDTLTGAAMQDQLISQAALNSVQYNKVIREIDNIAAQTNLTNSQVDLVKQQIINAFKTGQLTDAQVQNVIANTGNTQADTMLKQLDIPAAVNQANQQDSWWKKYVTPYLPDVLGVVNSASNLARSGASVHNSMSR